MTKVCSKCREEKSLSSFNKRKRNSSGLHSQCKLCTNKLARDYRKSHPEIIKRLDRVGHLKKKYNITQKQYCEMFEKQQGCCAICGRHQIVLDKTLHVDHNHKNGQIRGLLCHKCNNKLKHIEDTDFVAKAKIYLNEYDSIQKPEIN